MKPNFKDLIFNLEKYFLIQELACPHLFYAHGSNAWSFFDYSLLYNLWILREHIIQKPIIINNYSNNGNYSQRGFRCQVCLEKPNFPIKLRSYFSSHCLGKGIDLSVKGYSGKDMRQLIIVNSLSLPYHFRLEKNTSHLHFDTLCFDFSSHYELFT